MGEGDHVSGGWGNFVNGKCEEIEQFEVAPHPAYSATFSPKEKAKNLCWFAHFGKHIFINEINLLKTLARFGRGGTTQVVGEGLANMIKS